MGKINKKGIFLTSVVLCAPCYATQSYIVKPGDTLSRIVEFFTSPPPALYGKSGRLEMILKLNPHIKDEHSLKVGDIVYFGKEGSSVAMIEGLSNIDKIPEGVIPHEIIGGYAEYQRLEKKLNAIFVENHMHILLDKITFDESSIKEFQFTKSLRTPASTNIIVKDQEKKPLQSEPIVTKKEIVKPRKEEDFEEDDPGNLEFGFGWGPSFYIHDQSSVLGSAQVGVLVLDNLSLYSKYERKDFKLQMKLDSYNFYIGDGSSSAETSVLTYAIDTYFNNFLYGLAFEQQPLLKNQSGSTEAFSNTVINPKFGYEWNFLLSKKYETRFIFTPSIQIPIASFASEENFEVKKHIGFGVNLNTRLIREYGDIGSYQLNFFWDNEINYRTYERSVDWGIGEESFNSSHTNFKTIFGISIKLKD